MPSIAETGRSFAEVNSALNFWEALEYLSPQAPPKPELKQGACNYAVPLGSEGDSLFPWVDPKKQNDLKKLMPLKPNLARKFYLFAGILPGSVYTNAVRTALATKEVPNEEASRPKDAASLVLIIDENGFVSALPFVSTTPWAIGRLIKGAASGEAFEFGGFYGELGAQNTAVEALSAVLVKNTLIAADGVPTAAVDKPEAPENAVFDDAADHAATSKLIRPITAEDVRELTTTLFDHMGWRPEKEAPWIIQSFVYSKNKKTNKDEDPLNSFYAEDIELVHKAFAGGKIGAAFTQFVQSEQNANRTDIDADKDALLSGVHPSKLPAAAWPGSHPLVTAQQFAVNTIHTQLAEEGIFSVNGPPGTGKTTMLKDVIAMVVQRRADALAEFRNPLDAFEERINIEGGVRTSPPQRLHPSLCGFGMVAASANNGAVENISKELPGVGSIDAAVDVDYFSAISDSLDLEEGKSRSEERKSWGLISAALGNSTNRNRFVSSFWFTDKKSQLLPDGTANPLAQFCLPDWIEKARSAAPSWPVAVAQYKAARQRAMEEIHRATAIARLLQESSKLAREIRLKTEAISNLDSKIADLELQKQRVMIQRQGLPEQIESAERLLKLLEQHAKAEDALAAVRSASERHQMSRPQTSAPQIAKAQRDAEGRVFHHKRDIALHEIRRPGFIKRLLSKSSRLEWEAENAALHAVLIETQNVISDGNQALSDLMAWDDQAVGHQKAIEAATERLAELNSLLAQTATPESKNAATLRSDIFALRSKLAKIDEPLPSIEKMINDNQQTRLDLIKGKHADNIDHLIIQAKLNPAVRSQYAPNSGDLEILGRDDLHRSSPYQESGALFDARRRLFVAAMELHKAFIYHAWPKLKPALSNFVDLLGGKLNTSRLPDGAIQLWDHFFLVVPLVSTTFASFPRLFKGIRAADIPWLLIDEAGQAAPQQAVGGIWRSKRSVIVGDPLQLEPVVSVPNEILAPLKQYLGTDDRFIPPEASVQTMADRSNQFGTYLQLSSLEPPIWIGSPLIVHRRCLEPMFSIANKIAYDGKMVYGAGKDTLGAVSSCWLDTPAKASEGHWVEAQGQKALSAVEKLTGGEVLDANGKLRVFVITPFRVVATRMRQLLAQRFGNEVAASMCGTVHTFQGREADYVVFLLGGEPTKKGVITYFAGRRPNLINVAVTRAKKRLYVVGDTNFWCSEADANGYYRAMREELTQASFERATSATEVG